MNLIGVFAGLNNPGTLALRQYPGIYPRLALAVGLTTSAKELPIEVSFKTGEGKEVVPTFSGTFQIEQQAGAETSNVNFNLNFDAFQLEKPDKLVFSVRSGDNELGEVELTAVEPPPESTTA